MATTVEQEEPRVSLDASPDKKRHFRISTVLIVIVMCLGSMTFAYSLSVIATTLGQPSFSTYMKIDTKPNATAIIGATTSLYYAGGFFGALCSNWIGDRWGRKTAIMAGALIVLVSTALCAGSVHIAMFIVFRFFTGWGAFILMISVPLWILETVPPEVRGSFAQMHGVAVNLGQTLAAWVGVGFFLHVSSSASAAWRGPVAIGCVPCLLLLLGLWWLPESPRYLLMKGRDQDAWNIVRNFHSSPDNPDLRFAEAEMFQMRMQTELDRTLPSTWLDMFKRPSYRKRFGMTVFLTFALQATGASVIAIYATTLYSQLGFSPEKQLLLQSGMQTTNLPFTFACVFYTEKFRRPTLIVFGMMLLVATLSCYTALTAKFLDADTSASGKIGAVAMIFFYVAAYSGTVEGPLYYYSAEFWPTHLRAKGMAVQATTYAWTSILWAQSGSTALANIGWHFFLIFIVLSTIGASIIYFFYPDTQGKTLEEIGALFGDEDLVVVYQQDIHVDPEHHKVTAELHVGSEKVAVADAFETAAV